MPICGTRSLPMDGDGPIGMISLIEHEWPVQLIATSSDVHCDISTDTASRAISAVCCKRIADFLLRAMNGLAVARRASSHVQMHPSSSGSFFQAQQPDKHTNSDQHRKTGHFSVYFGHFTGESLTDLRAMDLHAYIDYKSVDAFLALPELVSLAPFVRQIVWHPWPTRNTEYGHCLPDGTACTASLKPHWQLKNPYLLKIARHRALQHGIPGEITGPRTPTIDTTAALSALLYLRDHCKASSTVQLRFHQSAFTAVFMHCSDIHAPEHVSKLLPAALRNGFLRYVQSSRARSELEREQVAALAHSVHPLSQHSLALAHSIRSLWQTAFTRTRSQHSLRCEPQFTCGRSRECETACLLLPHSCWHHYWVLLATMSWYRIVTRGCTHHSVNCSCSPTPCKYYDIASAALHDRSRNQRSSLRKRSE